MSVTRPLTITIPNFVEDARTQQQYTSILERRIKAYHSEQESAVRRSFAAKNDALNAEFAAAGSLIADRTQTAQKAMGAYRLRYPHRLQKSRPIKPSFFEWLLSFGGASRLYRNVIEANAAVIEAQTNQRRVGHKLDVIDSELARALAATEEKAKETTSSAEWLADLHRDRAIGDLKTRVDAIEHERDSYAKRLEAGRVSDDEQRDRTFAEQNVHDVDLPLTGVMFYRVDVFGSLVYYILRDLEKNLYALPYDPRLESIVDGVFDVYRVADTYDVRQRIHAESKLPFTILDHFVHCCDRQDVVARAAYRDQRAWMKPERTYRATPCSLDLERDIIKLLAEFAQTIPSPRAPHIL